MRLMIKSLLLTGALCAVAQGRALAQAQPDPNTQPAQPAPPISQPAQPSQTPATPDPVPPEPVQPAQEPVIQGEIQGEVSGQVNIPPSDPAVPPPTANVDVDVNIDPGTDRYSYAWADDTLQSGIGISTILGGGVLGFTDEVMRNTTSDVGGMWDLRVTIGSHVPLALDLSYLGSAHDINGLPTGQNGTLIGTTLEGALRYNMLPHNPVTPYVFAGVGWQRYDVTETNVSLSDSGMNDFDNLVQFPLGAGMAFRRSGFVADLRGTFRAATEQNLVLKSLSSPSSPTSDDFAPMHTWEASAAIGYEF
jgi:hypothetical protein